MPSSWKILADRTPPAHRWLLIVPVLLAVVFFTMREGYGNAQHHSDSPVGGAVVQADTGADYAALDGGIIALSRGGLLAYAQGIATVRAGEWDAVVWGGPVYVTLQGKVPTIAAFDVPVVIRGARGTLVIPPLSQWKAPASFLPDPAANPAEWVAATDTLPLPAAFVREKGAMIDNMKASVAGTTYVMSASVLGTADTPSLAAYALLAPSTRQLAAAVRSRTDLRLYGLVHPAIRDASWAFLPDHAEIDSDLWIGLLSLPVLERTDAIASPLTVRRWGETLHAAFDASVDPDALRSAILPVLESRITETAAKGFPLRALRFAQALHAAIGTGAVLTADAASSFLRVQEMTPETLRASALADIAMHLEAPKPIHTELTAPATPDPALEERARTMLAQRGGMFTPDSTVRTITSGTVEVRDVVFGLPTGDRPLRFEFLVESDAVRAMVDGRIQPYAVPFSAYMEWEATR